MPNFNTGFTKAQIITALTNGLNAATQADIGELSSSIETEIETRQDADSDIAEKLAYIVDSGAKNKMPMTHASGSITRYGVTCTWDSDAGTMTLSGSHVSTDSSAIFEFYSGNAADQKLLAAGTYHLSGVPNGGSTQTYRAALASVTGGADTGNGADFTITQPVAMAYRILVSGNVTFNNMVFKPMICDKKAFEISDKFVPYKPSNQDLYEMILAL